MSVHRQFKCGDKIVAVIDSVLEVGLVIETQTWTDVCTVETRSGKHSVNAYRMAHVPLVNQYFYFSGTPLAIVKAPTEKIAKEMLESYKKESVDQKQILSMSPMEAWFEYQSAMREKKGVVFDLVKELIRFEEGIPSILVLDDEGKGG